MCTARLTDFAKALAKQVKQAFAAGKKAIDVDALEAGLVAQDQARAEEAVDKALTVLETQLKERMIPLLQRVYFESANQTAERLPSQLSKTVRSAKDTAKKTTKKTKATDAVVDFVFDETNPAAIEWAEKYGAELVTGITKRTRDSIREAILAAFEEQRTPADLADEIADLIGDEDRAWTIARTETMSAANYGQQAAWDQAIDAGLLTGTEKQVWIVTPDDLLCPYCEPLDGALAPLGGQFDTDEGDIDGPPLHPNCRCTIGLQVD